MFRRSSVAAIVGLSVWLVASVAMAAPSRSAVLTLSTPDASVVFSIANGQVDSVTGTALCANGNIESWTSDAVVSSTIDLGRGPNLNRIAAIADVVHLQCDGTVSTDREGIRAQWDEAGKTVRERDRSTGTRTLTTPVAGRITLPNDVLTGAGGTEVETISH